MQLIPNKAVTYSISLTPMSVSLFIQANTELWNCIYSGTVLASVELVLLHLFKSFPTNFPRVTSCSSIISILKQSSTLTRAEAWLQHDPRLK